MADTHGLERCERANPLGLTDEQLAAKKQWVNDQLAIRPNIVGGAFYLDMLFENLATMSTEEIEAMRERVEASERGDDSKEKSVS